MGYHSMRLWVEERVPSRAIYIRMRITTIKVFRVDLPIAGNGYKVSGGRVFKTLDSTFVLVETDAGIVGMGEGCPLGSAALSQTEVRQQS